MEELTMRFDLVVDHENNQFRAEVTLWDGDQYVSSKYFQMASLTSLWRSVKAFVKYWTDLYFDKPSMTPDKFDAAGQEQLKLGI